MIFPRSSSDVPSSLSGKRRKLGRLALGLGAAGLAAWLLFGAPGEASAQERTLSALAERPDWSRLEPFQRTITRGEFLSLLEKVYAPEGAWRKAIEIGPTAAVIRQPGSKRVDFRLEFAPDRASARPVPRYWQPAGTRPKVPGKPLAGYTVAIDPGHIGGRWAKMEERWFTIGKSAPVMEGEMVLVVARLLEKRLEAMGAKVVLVRERNAPVTKARPEDFRKEAIAELRRKGIKRLREGFNGSADPLKYNSIQWQSELFFYRVSEIRERAKLVNGKLHPDLLVCLHFNAEAWGDPNDPRLSDKNHLHLLVNGNYWESELRNEDVRFDLLNKLLNRSASEELPLSDAVAKAMAKGTGLPPYTYTDRARRVTADPYVWSRNLLANRLYVCPVIFLEPYVMNSHAVFERVQLGDYSGTRLVRGQQRKSLYREYADSVAEGIRDYFLSR